MGKVITGLMLLIFFVTVPAVTLAAGPPRRPLEVTDRQLEYLRQLESRPEHSAVLNIHAAYKSEQEKRAEWTLLGDDILTGAYTIGFPATVVILLMAAAPL